MLTRVENVGFWLRKGAESGNSAKYVVVDCIYEQHRICF